tara:strand:- start:5589 stop:6017 length:429 start_codon:yes stop_codon:yes gene_type:complete
MIRIFLIIVLFISYGNFNYVINDLCILSLINIAFFSILKNKKVKMIDFLIYIFSTLIIEILIDLPILFSTAVVILFLYAFSYVINNLSMNKIFTSLIIFILSLIALFFLNTSLYIRIVDFKYLLSLIILLSIYLGLKKYGKE